MTTDIFTMLGHDPESKIVKDAMEDTKAADELVARLVELRKEREMTVEQVAAFMEVAADEVRELESAGSDPHLSQLQRYVRAIDGELTVSAYLTQINRPSRAGSLGQMGTRKR